jgi:hypothetical protein
MRRNRNLVVLATFLAASWVWNYKAFTQELYYRIPVQELKITEGSLPVYKADARNSFRLYPQWEAMRPVAVLDLPAEGYLEVDQNTVWSALQYPTSSHLIFRAPAGSEVHGVMSLPTHELNGMTRVAFSIPEGKAKEVSAEKYYEAKLQHYMALHQRPIAGTAWFNHQVRAAEKKLNEIGADKERTNPQVTIRGPIDNDRLYAVFSGGRAISENLQVDRALRETKPEEPTVPVDSIDGISIAAIDWTSLIKGIDPKLDPLAKCIPADQHAVFFPTFEAAIKLSDEAKGGHANLMRMAEPRSEDARTMEFYQRQLGLPLSVLARALGGNVVKSVAITGSDPYFRVGTDVAVLLETKNGVVVMAALLTQIQNSVAKEKQVFQAASEIDGVAYRMFSTRNRQLSSYIAQLDNTVVVTNSLAQLENLVAVFKGQLSLASLDEYKFFRHRYPLGDADETAFVFLSDAAIRRWCSPRWRIASARRTFAAAALAELTAEYAKDIGGGKVEEGALHTDLPLVEPGKLKLMSAGVESSTLGNLEWMTPIVEMPIEKVTKAEAESYEQWRRGYERNWRWAFDPIGLRISLSDKKLAGDLTVMPLIASSDYRWLIALSRGASIPKGGGDQHDALMQMALAVNIKSDPVEEANHTAGSFLNPAARGPRIDPFSWLGQTVSLYVDDDPLWKELAETPDADREKFMRRNVGRFPIALYCDVSDSARLIAFLAGLRGFIEPSAPGMVNWETGSYRDESYVKVSPTRQGRDMVGEEVGPIALYYAPSADGIVFTLNEAVLKRAIDRRLERRAAKEGKAAEEKAKPAGSAQPWLGSNFCLQVDRRMFHIFSGNFWSMFGVHDAYQAAMQMRSWGNLPILNEWKRMFPDQDPVEVHEKLWKVKLICPGGGKYVWNDAWKTMESTVYGHPGEPERGEETPAGLEQFDSANFGLTFEQQGLRARMELLREAK